jgi:hypothetical protein
MRCESSGSEITGRDMLSDVMLCFEHTAPRIVLQDLGDRFNDETTDTCSLRRFLRRAEGKTNNRS